MNTERCNSIEDCCQVAMRVEYPCMLDLPCERTVMLVTEVRKIPMLQSPLQSLSLFIACVFIETVIWCIQEWLSGRVLD
jgi:hypothetical protein